jgi:hypothetical protein
MRCTIAGTCYAKVRAVTVEIKKKMMEYNPYKGEQAQDREVHVKFEDDEMLDAEVVDGRRVVELPRTRPTWFKPEFGVKKLK